MTLVCTISYIKKRVQEGTEGEMSEKIRNKSGLIVGGDCVHLGSHHVQVTVLDVG